METDPDLALVRQLHLELNGSGRRTRGTGPPPAKKIKREPITSTGPSKSSSLSHSASDTPKGGKGSRRPEGTLRRLIKKQPDSDSNQNQIPEDDNTTVQNGQKDALEPQASTKIASDSKKPRVGDGDVGSRNTANFADIGLTSLEMGQDHAVTLAQSSASRELAKLGPRVKCFYQGSPYGISLDATACSSRDKLKAALQEALLDEMTVSHNSDVDIFVYTGEGQSKLCRADEPDDNWVAASKGAMRIYLKTRCPVSAS